MKFKLFSLALFLLVASFLCLMELPTAAADNSVSTARATYSGNNYQYVCYDDGCGTAGNYGSGIDQYDYWERYMYYGDRWYFSVYNYCNPDDAELGVAYSPTTSSGWTTVSSSLGCSSTASTSTQSVTTSGYYYFYVEAHDTFWDDGSDYRLYLYHDTTYRDQDQDGYDDSQDDCPTTYGTSDRGNDIGCPDSDGDGYANIDDDFPNDSNEWRDSDNDGYGNNQDDCDNSYGTSDMNGIYGCPDSDGDGYANTDDDLPNDPNEWRDSDNDGYGNNQDDCDNSYGTSDMNGIYGCPDSDGDGYANTDDAFPNDSSEWDDSDSDGVGDNSDNCNSEDATGYDNNNDGCIDDSDGDGYKDNVDQCVNEDSRGYDQNQDGCIDDSDGDGLKDNVDQCVNEDSRGYDQNQDGCIDDSDGDGYKDNVDQCVNEDSRGYDQNQDGCIDDSDNDGVKDNEDTCENTQQGQSVDQFGCSANQMDGDHDGVFDEVDDCQNEDASGYDQDQDGCIDDTDSDGFKDNVDECYEEDSRGYDQNSDGCIDDTDTDGVKDNVDQCEGEISTGYDSNNDGCIDDTDSDGVNDKIDQCDNTTDDPNDSSLPNAVDQYGCGWSQRDDDSDGVMNSDDECPNDIQGIDGENGCPATDIRLSASESTYSVNSTEELTIYIDVTNSGSTSETVNIDAEDTFLSPYGVAIVDPQFVEFTINSGQTIPIRITLTIDAASMANMPLDAVRTNLIIKATSQSGITITSEITIDFFKLETNADDIDSDGFRTELDDCPNTFGTSMYDRNGCPDNDDDGWSDPSNNWLAHPDGTADAFPNDSTKWRDESSSVSGSNDASSFTSILLIIMILIIISSAGAGVVIFRNKNRENVPALWGANSNNLPPPNQIYNNQPPHKVGDNKLPPPAIVQNTITSGGIQSTPGQYTDEQLLSSGWTAQQIEWHRIEQAKQASLLTPAPHINLTQETNIPTHICTLCQGRIKDSSMMHKCGGCGKPFHNSCSERIPSCPQCGTPIN